MFHSFYGGVHPKGKKDATKSKAVEPLTNQPAQVVIPMLQHVGAPCKPLVSKGDTVLVGQKIGEPTGLGAPVHASVSGTVAAVEPRPHAGGTPVMSVVIDNDMQDTPAQPIPRPADPEKLTAQQVVDLVKEAGITGMGGAGFPTHVKLSGAIGKVDTLILNGSECEPYITADHRLMLEEGEKLLSGIRVLMGALGLDKAYVGIEDNKPDAVEYLRSLVGEKKDIEICSLQTKYPEGAEKQLIQKITGRQIPPGKLPADVQCAVFNVATAVAVHDAVYEGKPLTHRLLTVTGGAIEKPRNLRVPIGTSFEHIIEEGGGFKGEPDRVITGGPMMGIAQFDLSVPVMKGTNAVTALAADEVPPQEADPTCIRCGNCVDHCPMHLMPVMIHNLMKFRRYSELGDYNTMDCIECGSCSYGCPARIPLVQIIRAAKMEMRKLPKKEGA